MRHHMIPITGQTLICHLKAAFFKYIRFTTPLNLVSVNILLIFGRAASSERLKRRFLWPRSLQKWRAVPDWPTLALPSSLQAAHQPHELINLSSDSQGSGAGFSTGQHSKAFLVRVSHSQNLRVRRVFSNTLKFSCQNLVAKLSASITRAACESIKQSRDFKVRVSRARPFEIFGENRTRNLIDHLLSLSVI